MDSAPSSYIRFGSNAPNPTHLPLRPAGANTSTGYILPPPHEMSLPHSGLSPSHLRSPPIHQSHDPMNGAAHVSTYDDLKRHYDGLTDKQKKIDQMSEKDQRMIAGVKRGLDEMQRGGGNGMQEPGKPRSGQSILPLEATQRE